MKRLEINQSNEWLRVFSAVSFDGIEDEDQDSAANDYTDHLMLALESAGFETIPARGKRRTCHGWNGANTFRHTLGPVGSFSPLTAAEIEMIQSICDRAAEAMRRDWVADPT